MITFANPNAESSDVQLARFYAERRYSQLRRVFATMEVLQGFRFGADLETVHADAMERLGETWSQRTTRRDLEFLLDTGVVLYLPEHGVFRWAGRLNTPTLTIPEVCEAGHGTRKLPLARAA